MSSSRSGPDAGAPQGEAHSRDVDGDLVRGEQPATTGRTLLGRSSDTPHDAIGAYFRGMGRRDALSRVEEVAIARRIEAGQQALRDALFLTPMFAGRIRQWGSELRQGHLRLRDFADLSASHLEWPHGPDGRKLHEPMTSEIPHRAGDGPVGKEAVDNLAAREAMLMPDVVARMETIDAGAGEIAVLSQKRIAAVALGRDLSVHDHARLQDLLSSLKAGMDGVYLHPNRISDLGCGRGRATRAAPA